MIGKGKSILMLAAVAALVTGCAQMPKTIPPNRGAESAQAHKQVMVALADKVQTSIASDDLADAQRAAIQYASAPDADPKMLAQWRQQIWTMSESWGTLDGSHPAKREIKDAVAELKRQHLHEKKMSPKAFTEWIAKQGATTQGEPLFSRIDVGKNRVQLWVANKKVPDLAFNMEKLVTVNDALVARCGCDGRTNVGDSGTGFPVYLVRLDPETRQSQVIVLPR